MPELRGDIYHGIVTLDHAGSGTIDLDFKEAAALVFEFVVGDDLDSLAVEFCSESASSRCQNISHAANISSLALEPMHMYTPRGGGLAI